MNEKKNPNFVPKQTFWEYCAEVANHPALCVQHVIDDIDAVARCFDANLSIDYCVGLIEGRRLILPPPPSI